MSRFLLLLSFLFLPNMMTAQIDLDAYKQYMSEHQGISYQQLLDEFDVGTFDRYCPTDYSKAYYFDSTNQFINFTPDELQLLSENGFVVTERKEVENYIKGYYNIFVNDLPVYISADLFNHALFYTMTKTMKLLEKDVLSKMFIEIINDFRAAIPNFKAKSTNQKYQDAIRDIDVIFCVAQNLANNNATYATPYNAEDSTFSKYISNLILSSAEGGTGMHDIDMPSGFQFIMVDISQYKPRGHYAEDETLRRYFMSMMWMGRLFLPVPEDEEQIQQQQSSLIMSGLVADIVNQPTLKPKYDKFDDFLEFYISEQNNLTIQEVPLVYQKMGVGNIAEVVENNRIVEYCKKLRATNRGVQLYNTQCVYDGDFEDDGQSPQYFSLFGQRPTVDAFVFGNVVFPMIKGNIRRMLPESMDILFALGNDAAFHLLKNEINKYHYGPNIASCRYLFDNLSDEAWETSVYNLWIEALRTLNPPKNREELPKFMQAAAWQHKNMSTQLASWAELRHLTVLYVKQSYTGIPICDFPDFFIEPRPEYFRIMGQLNMKIVDMLGIALADNPNLYELRQQKEMFEQKQEIYANLDAISAKQYSIMKLSDDDVKYLKNMIFGSTVNGCATMDIITGWIYELFHEDHDSQSAGEQWIGENLKPTKVTTDVHTSPSDENEVIVGWVKHAATGNQNYCTIVTDNCNGKPTAYTGVVNSYYEYVTENFQRDTDEEWLAKIDQIPAPSFTNVYRANKEGYKMPLAELVKTHDVSVEDENASESYSIGIYPNVFEDEFTIAVNSTENYAGIARISMYSSTGEIIFDAEYNNLPNGQIVLNPADYGLTNLTSGVYIIELKIGEKVYSGKAIKII